jgi:hypothetical protein
VALAGAAAKYPFAASRGQKSALPLAGLKYIYLNLLNI